MKRRRPPSIFMLVVVAATATALGVAGCDRPETPRSQSVAPPADIAAAAGTDSPDERAARLAERLRGLPRAAPAASADPAADQAIGLLTAGQNEAAEALLRAALHDRPQDARLHFLMALAIHKQTRYAEARRWYDAAIDARRSTPEIDQLPHFLGWCLYYLGAPEEARVAFEDHVRRIGDEADSLFALGIIALEDDRIEDAERLLIRSIEAITPTARHAARDAAKAHVRLGDVYVRLERLDEAERHLRHGVALHADHYEGWAKLARLLHRLRRPDEAESAQRSHDEAQRRVGRG